MRSLGCTPLDREFSHARHLLSKHGNTVANHDQSTCTWHIWKDSLCHRAGICPPNNSGPKRCVRVFTAGCAALCLVHTSWFLLIIAHLVSTWVAFGRSGSQLSEWSLFWSLQNFFETFFISNTDIKLIYYLSSQITQQFFKTVITCTLC